MTEGILIGFLEGDGMCAAISSGDRRGGRRVGRIRQLWQADISIIPMLHELMDNLGDCPRGHSALTLCISEMVLLLGLLQAGELWEAPSRRSESWKGIFYQVQDTSSGMGVVPV